LPGSRKLFAVLIATSALALGTAGCGDDDDAGGESDGAPIVTTETEPSKSDAGNRDASKKADDDSPSSSSPSPSSSGSSGKVYGDGSIQRFGEAASESDDTAIVSAATAFYDARASDDWKAACDLMTSGIREQLGRGFTNDKKADAPDCPAVLAGLAGGLPKALRQQQADTLRFTEVRVDGEGAYAVFESKPIPHGFVPMRREDGEWKVAAIAGSSL